MNFAQARLNMVENQVRPNRIKDPLLLEALGQTPREAFLPSALHAQAYSDQALLYSPHRHLLAPLLFAQLLDAAKVTPSDKILDVGCGSGYATAVLSILGGIVFGLESHPPLAAEARTNLSALQRHNARVETGILSNGMKEEGPFDVIFIQGSLHAVPRTLLDQLNEGGRLVAIFKPACALGRLTFWTKTKGDIAQTSLHEANAPVIPDLAITKKFVF